MTPIVVVHDVGATGSPWRDALAEWPDDVCAPDLVLETASGDRTDVVWLLLDQMEAWRDRAPVVVGCGEFSLAAETFALAGWTGPLVLVDGLGGAWTTPEEQIDAQNEWLRAKFRDPDFVGYPQVWIEPFFDGLRSNVRCPVLLVETPASITAADEAERRRQQYAGQADLVRLDSADQVQVVEAVSRWVGS
jgi:hypothetical protein